MEILRSLGVNSTLWIQLACFLVSYAALSNLVLKPYLAAYHEREKRTTGNESTAVRLIEETNDLRAEYERKARAMNAQVRTAYDETRQRATEEYDRILSEARAEASKILQDARVRIKTEIQSARQSLSAEIPQISLAIASKLAGKEMSS